tara:strand:+ start:98 stop:316 length:219 start_codon:yes stop_codon:yes gene_type:complete
LHLSFSLIRSKKSRQLANNAYFYRFCQLYEKGLRRFFSFFVCFGIESWALVWFSHTHLVCLIDELLLKGNLK